MNRAVSCAKSVEGRSEYIEAIYKLEERGEGGVGAVWTHITHQFTMYSPGLLLRGLKDLRRERKKARLFTLLFNPISHTAWLEPCLEFENLNSKYYFSKNFTLLTLLWHLLQLLILYRTVSLDDYSAIPSMKKLCTSYLNLSLVWQHYRRLFLITKCYRFKQPDVCNKPGEQLSVVGSNRCCKKISDSGV